jgi:hypothetical protein
MKKSLIYEVPAFKKYALAMIMGPNPSRGMDVCVSVYFVFFCMWAAALRPADPPCKESCKIKKLKISHGETKGCRAIDR